MCARCGACHKKSGLAEWKLSKSLFRIRSLRYNMWVCVLDVSIVKHTHTVDDGPNFEKLDLNERTVCNKLVVREEKISATKTLMAPKAEDWCRLFVFLALACLSLSVYWRGNRFTDVWSCAKKLFHVRVSLSLRRVNCVTLLKRVLWLSK